MEREAGMSERAKACLVALKARLETMAISDVTVYLGRVVDPSQDPLPVVTVHYRPDGETLVSDTSYHTQQMRLALVVELWARVNVSDPLMDLEDFDSLLRAAAINGNDDTLDGTAYRVSLVRRRSLVPEEHDNIGCVQLELDVYYVEEF
jgi:hypothetical protein